MSLGKNGDAALAKLVAAPENGQAGAAGLLEAALEALDYKRDGDAAMAILIEILCNDNLAAKINRRLSDPNVDAAVRAFLGLPQ